MPLPTALMNATFLALAFFLVSQVKPIRLPPIAWARKTDILFISACETHWGGNSKWQQGAGASTPFHVKPFITKSTYKCDFFGTCLLSRVTGQTNPPATNCLSKKKRHFVHLGLRNTFRGQHRVSWALPYQSLPYFNEPSLAAPLPNITLQKLNPLEPKTSSQLTPS